jgi:glutaredoxin-like protein
VILTCGFHVYALQVFPEREAARLRELFAKLEREIELVLVLGPEETPLPGARDIDFAAEAQKLVEGIAELGDLVSARVTDEPELGAERFPAIAVLADGEDMRIRYYGLPWGYELSSLVGAVVEAGRPESSLHHSSLALLDGLERDVAIDVFVTPTCPHCPPAVLLAYRAALASPRVTAAAIEATEFPSLADAMDVYSVPTIVIGGVPRYDGAVPEGVFFHRLLEYA